MALKEFLAEQNRSLVIETKLEPMEVALVAEDWILRQFCMIVRPPGPWRTRSSLYARALKSQYDSHIVCPTHYAYLKDFHFLTLFFFYLFALPRKWDFLFCS